MKTEHPITPSIELVKQWSDHWHRADDNDFDHALFISIRAARWGADQELEACIKLLADLGGDGEMIRRYRRPRPPSKDEALDELSLSFDRGYLKKNSVDIIRHALESLPD